MTVNHGVRPLGGKHATGKSLVVAAEVAHLKAMGADMREVGFVDSNERAEKMREVLVKHNPSLSVFFEEWRKTENQDKTEENGRRE